MLTKQFLPISKGQFIENIFTQIPSNVIVDKVLPGIRATSKEINTPRNTILLECNVPVIKDKCKKFKHMNVIGVYKDTPDDLDDYLQSNIEHKKIMVTPESFPLLMDVMRKYQIDVYSEFFLLWDESERTIQDIYYRGRIILPIDDFFKFKQKAFISATALPPSDPRFQEQKFIYVKLQPDFDYKQKIRLIHTNNVVTRLKQYFAEHPSEHYFIFLNSTKSIAAMQKALKIKEESFIFCAYESSLRLKVSKFPNCSTELGAFRKYNFFTSRFFSAVDIDFPGDPSIIIITDLVYAEHSMIDPYSEAVQIIGRFRKPIGTIKDVCHITNSNSAITSKNVEETEKYLEQHEFLYNGVKGLQNGATDFGSAEALREALIVLPWSKYINDDGSTNYFMIDNAYFVEKIKSYYKNISNLCKAYKACGYFDVQFSEEMYEFTDKDRFITERTPLRNVAKIVMRHLHQLEAKEYTSYQQLMETQILHEYFPEVVNLYAKLGFSVCNQLNFNIKAMEDEVKRRNKQEEKNGFEFIRTINRLFSVGCSYSSSDIKTFLMQAINKHKSFLLTANVQLLKLYFELSERHTIGYKPCGSDIKGYTILAAKYL